MWTAAHDHVPSGKGESIMGIFALFGRKKESGEKTDDKVVYSPVKGEVIRLEDVEDEAFASGAMGPGIGIRPLEGMVCAPVSGQVCAIFPTGHAVGIRREDGVEVLLHIGIDTVNMKGDGFDVKVGEGALVRVGDPLVKVDLDKVQTAGYQTTIMLLITNASAIGGELADIHVGPVEARGPIFSYTSGGPWV